MTNKSYASRPWLVLLELLVFGFFNSLLKVVSIIALLRFDAIFTSASQLLLLLPAAACILLVILMVAFADAQCNNYMAELDIRLLYISNLLQSQKPPGTKSFLQRILLPILSTMPATPIVGFFLAITTPWLLLILTLNIVVSCFVIYKFNTEARLILTGSESIFENSSVGSQYLHGLYNGKNEIAIPAYLLRDQVRGSAYLEEDQIMIRNEGRELEKILLKKRKSLEIVRSIFYGLVLATSAILAIAQLASLTNIVGFFILGSTFRSAFIALAEFYFPRGERIPLKQAYEFLCLALISPKEFQFRLEAQYADSMQELTRFNQDYQKMIRSRPFLRFHNISLIHKLNGIQINKLNARLELKSCSLVRVSSPQLAHEIRTILRQIGTVKLQDWQLSGEAFCGRQRLTGTFLKMIPIRAPWRIRISSTSIEGAFSLNQQEYIRELSRKYGLNQLLYGEDIVISDIKSLSRRQLQRLRSLIALLIVILEPACLSISAFALDSFEIHEISILMDMVDKETSDLGIFTIFITRRPLGGLPLGSYYELSRSDLRRILL